MNNSNMNRPFAPAPDSGDMPIAPPSKSDQPGNTSVVFRSSMKGYNREDVNSYIENMTLSFNRAKADIVRKVNELENQKAELGKQLDELRQEKDNEAAASSEIITRQAATIDELTAKIDALTSAPAEKQSAASGIFTASPDDIDSLKQKAEAYEKISRSLGDILMFAKTQAEEIIEKAERSAQEVRNSAIDAAEQIQSELSGKSDGIIGTFNASLGEISDKYLVAFTESLSGISKSLESAIDACRPGADAPAREELRRKLSALEKVINKK